MILFSLSTESIDLPTSDSVTTKINSYSKLPKGWDCGFGKPISKEVINRAIDAYLFLKDLGFQYECTPLSNNSIQITFFIKDNFLDVTVTYKTFELVYEKGIGEDFTTEFEYDDISLQDIKQELEKIRDKCFLLEPSISRSIVRVKKDSKTVLRTWEKVSPSLNFHVQSSTPKQFVLT